jgi:hypothetical protein
VTTGHSLKVLSNEEARPRNEGSRRRGRGQCGEEWGGLELSLPRDFPAWRLKTAETRASLEILSPGTGQGKRGPLRMTENSVGLWEVTPED